MQTQTIKKPISYKNLLIGAVIQVFEVSTLGQPFEVVKTHMAANSNQGLITACKNIYSASGLKGFWRGLIPWAWIEASTKGAVLLFTSTEIEYRATNMGLSSAMAGIVAGAGGGIAQAYSTMGFCTFMKTVEVTRHRTAGPQKSSFQIASEIFKKEGIVGINKGVNAVAVRQMTNWGSRLGISRVVESGFKSIRPESEREKKLTKSERLLSSIVGGALACWNQPIEVIRVKIRDPSRPTKMTMFTCAKWIWQKDGLKGFYRGVTPRIGLSAYLTACMVFGGDEVKSYFNSK